MPKDALVKARVSQVLKKKVEDEATRCGESEAVVVRAALKAYLMNDERSPQRETPKPVETPVNYRNKPKGRRPRPRISEGA